MADLGLGLEFRGQRFDSAADGLRYFATTLNADFEKVVPVLRKELETYLKGVSTLMARTHAGAWPGGTSATSLSQRTGAALQSIKDSVKVSGDTVEDIEGRIGGIFYLKIHEFGGTIVPKNAKYLTVPLPAALDGSGVPLKRSARDWDRTFVMKSKNGNLLICQRGAGKSVTPLYVLVKSVKIPPRLGMRDALDRGRQFFVDRAVSQMLKVMRNG